MFFHLYLCEDTLQSTQSSSFGASRTHSNEYDDCPTYFHSSSDDGGPNFEKLKVAKKLVLLLLTDYWGGSHRHSLWRLGFKDRATNRETDRPNASRACMRLKLWVLLKKIFLRSLLEPRDKEEATRQRRGPQLIS